MESKIRTNLFGWPFIPDTSILATLLPNLVSVTWCNARIPRLADLLPHTPHAHQQRPMHSYSNSSSGGSQRSLHAKRPTSEQLLRQRQAAQHSAAAALDDTTNLPSKRRRLAIEDDASQASSLKLGPDWDGNESTFTQPGSTPNYHAASSMPPPPSSIFQTSSNPLDLSHVQWGLRREIVLGFKGAGIEQMYPWQAECLQLPNLLEGTKNVVYTAPTSGGKSFVADMLVIKRVLEQQKKALVVLPYIAIVQEKTRFLKKVLRNVKTEIVRKSEKQRRRWRPVNVVGYHSGAKSRIGWKELDVAVCTIEKVGIPSYGQHIR